MAFKRIDKQLRNFRLLILAVVMLVLWLFLNSLEDTIPTHQITKEYKLDVKL